METVSLIRQEKKQSHPRTPRLTYWWRCLFCIRLMFILHSCWWTLINQIWHTWWPQRIHASHVLWNNPAIHTHQVKIRLDFFPLQVIHFTCENGATKHHFKVFRKWPNKHFQAMHAINVQWMSHSTTSKKWQPLELIPNDWYSATNPEECPWL